MDFTASKKVIAEATFVTYNQTFFFIGFQHGATDSAYVFDPEGAKAFSENLAKRIAEYESTIRPIDSSGLQLGTVSPFQPKK